MISLGQSNTIVSCPSLTTHSELSEEALREAGMSPTTIRFAIGDENPIDLIKHLIHTARATIDPDVPGFAAGFMSESESKKIVRDLYLDAHSKHVDAQIGDDQWF